MPISHMKDLQAVGVPFNLYATSSRICMNFDCSFQWGDAPNITIWYSIDPSQWILSKPFPKCSADASCGF